MGNKPQAHAGFRLLVLRYACALRTLSESDVRRCSIPHDRCRSCVEERPGPGPVICPGTIRGGRCETQSQLAGCASRKLRLYVAYSTSTWDVETCLLLDQLVRLRQGEISADARWSLLTIDPVC